VLGFKPWFRYVAAQKKHANNLPKLQLKKLMTKITERGKTGGGIG
jgi:hypothetical protein